MPIARHLRTGLAVGRTVFATFERPDRAPRALLAMAPWGSSVAGLVAGAAARYPEATAVIDDAGAITYAELWRRVRRLAAALEADGVGPGSTVGLLARNHRGFVETLAAVAATGADLVLMNTGFAGPQLADVAAHEGVDVLVHDDEFTEIAVASGVAHLLDEATRDAHAARPGEPRRRRRQGAIVTLTSGTTGRPKGAARRGDTSGVESVAAVLERIPLRLRDTQVVPAPLFHAWGLSHLLLGLARCATTVLARRFDPVATLAAVERHRARVLIVVPVMLARMMSVTAGRRWPDVDSLEVIASSGSAVGADLVETVHERFGPVLYNLYGSTEVAAATIATPDDLARAPSTVGRAVQGVRVEIVDENGRPVGEDEVGRIFVGGALSFDGYTDGADKERLRGMLSTGDMGRRVGDLYFVEGRDDDMIVSGGENVFPGEVEELVRRLPGVDDVAVIGEPDDEYGQALAAFVVLHEGVTMSADEVRAHVHDQLARHKVPRRVEFVDELPRNETGKLVRRSLR